MASRSRSRSRSPSKSISKSKSRSKSPYNSHSRSRSRSHSRSRSPTHSRSQSRSHSKSRSRSARSRSRSRSRTHSRSRSRSESPDRRRRRSSGDRSEDTGVRVGTRIHVGSLSSSTSTRDIQEEFGRFGEIIDMWMPRTHPPIAFVVYSHKDSAMKAIKRMDGETLHSRRIRVSLARPRSQGVRGGAYNPNLRCYQCGKKGHFSRDCWIRGETRRERYDREHSRWDSPRRYRRRSSSSRS